MNTKQLTPAQKAKKTKTIDTIIAQLTTELSLTKTNLESASNKVALANKSAPLPTRNTFYGILFNLRDANLDTFESQINLKYPNAWATVVKGVMQNLYPQHSSISLTTILK